jgi:DNA helicase-2/ATP-dependent DNA helicase PcrA
MDGPTAAIERIVADLTPEQRAAVEHMDGPLIVVAGPGSGKTRVITRRVAHLVARGVPPWQILAITFTNKAAGEMRRRIEDLIGPAGVFVSTFHSFCARMLRRYEPPGRKASYAIYDEDDQRACAKQAIRDLQLDESQWRPGDALARISAEKNRLVSVERFEEMAAGFRDRMRAKIYRRYEELLAQYNALDFDDLLLAMVKVLDEREEARAELQARFRYILVDEYQDTNRPQYLLAKLLAGEARNICVVGDPDQSIYKWRGADIRNILEFEKDYPGAREIRLERNYRSTRRILAAAQALIEHNCERREKSLWTANEEGEPIRLVRALSDDDEALAVARAIGESIGAGTPPAEIAVFYRAAALSRKFEEALRARGIKHIVIGAVPFFQRKEVKDALAFIRVLANPADEVQVRRATATIEGIGAATLERLARFAAERGVTLFEAVARVEENPDVKAPGRRAVRRFAAIFAEMQAAGDGAVGPMLKHVALASGIRDRLAASGDPQDQARLANIEALVNEAYEHDERAERGEAEPGVFGFLDHVALLSSADRDGDAAEGAVRLMTLHAAKGLEFDEVYIVGVDARLLPLEREAEAPDVEEERRLFYVGLTRARKRVTLTTARSRRTWGQERACLPSPFLRDLPPECLEARGAFAVDSAPDEDDFVRGGARARHADDDDDDDREPVIRPIGRPARPARPAPPPAAFESPAWPAAPRPLERAPAKADADLVPGDRVTHAVFGTGEIVQLTGAGLGRRVQVEFDGVGTKTLVLHYANLQRI